MSEQKRLGVIPKGTIFTVTAGCQDWYSVSGTFVVFADIDIEAELMEYLAAHVDQTERGKFDEPAFLGAICRKQLIEASGCIKWHIDDDHEAEPTFSDDQP